MRSLRIWPKNANRNSSLELTVAKEKKVRALRKKLAGLDKQVSNISVIDSAGYKLKMCVHCGFLQVSCFKCYIKTVCLLIPSLFKLFTLFVLVACT